MKRTKTHSELRGYVWLCLCSFILFPSFGYAQAEALVKVEQGDTLYVVALHDLYVYAPLRFKDKRQERFYWRTVRDVKKVLPYVRMIRKDMEFADEELAKIHDSKEQKRWWKKYEKYLFSKYEDDFRHMYASQGQMLMLLMSRETDHTSYDLIKRYRGKASANWWQFIAKLFKNDLKDEYDGNDKDAIIERVIHLVEAGQL